MKKDLVEILCCPICKGDLELKNGKKENGEIVEGIFICKECNCDYTIRNGIPDLLPK
jgi:uncharacterized protein YbaR (Trm112 family)